MKLQKTVDYKRLDKRLVFFFLVAFLFLSTDWFLKVFGRVKLYAEKQTNSLHLCTARANNGAHAGSFRFAHSLWWNGVHPGSAILFLSLYIYTVNLGSPSHREVYASDVRTCAKNGKLEIWKSYSAALFNVLDVTRRLTGVYTKILEGFCAYSFTCI